MKLTRYNEIILALAGTGFLLLLIVAVVEFGMAMTGSRRDPGLVVQPARPGAPAPERSLPQNLAFCDAVTEPGGTYQYIAVNLVSATDASSNPVLMVSKSESGGPYFCTDPRYGAPSRTFNVIVRDLARGTQHLLLDHPAQIVRFEVPEKKCVSGEGNTPCDTVLWEIRDEDSNHDGVIDNRDATTAYVSALDANKLIALTPRGVNTLGVLWIPATNKWQVRVRRDANQDGRFTEEDGAELLEADTRSPAMAQPFIQDAIMQSLKRLSK